MKVPHEVTNQRALAKRTSQKMKNGQDINQSEVVLGAPDRVNIPCLMHEYNHARPIKLKTIISIDIHC